MKVVGALDPLQDLGRASSRLAIEQDDIGVSFRPRNLAFRVLFRSYHVVSSWFHISWLLIVVTGDKFREEQICD